VSELAQTPADEGALSLTNVLLQFGLMCILFNYWSSPVVHPVKMIVVLFHEMSHGLMALVTGGKILSIEITPDEGGACETEGGAPLLIVSAGYLGSMLFGGAILYLSRFRQQVPLVFGMLSLIVGSAIITVMGDTYSQRFAATVAAVFVIAGFLVPAFFGSVCLRAIGTVCCVYSIFDIYWDVLADRGTHALQNDAVVFSSLSGVDARTVGMFWLVSCVIFFLFVLKAAVGMSPEDAGDEGGEAAPA
ncbi:MAG: M50 family metallopeptidase, partial [Planctomycetota bacterium]